MEIFWNQTEGIVAQHCNCTKRDCTVYFKMVDFMLCKFHLNKIFKKRSRGGVPCTSGWNELSAAGGSEHVRVGGHGCCWHPAWALLPWLLWELMDKPSLFPRELPLLTQEPLWARCHHPHLLPQLADCHKKPPGSPVCPPELPWGRGDHTLA